VPSMPGEPGAYPESTQVTGSRVTLIYRIACAQGHPARQHYQRNDTIGSDLVWPIGSDFHQRSQPQDGGSAGTRSHAAERFGAASCRDYVVLESQAAWNPVDRRSMNQPAAAVAVVAAAPSRLTGTPATRLTGYGGSSTAVPGTAGARRNGAQ
jgi:hypothetical protein